MILTKEKIDKIDIDSIVNDRINNKKINEILFIVPTRRKLRYFTRELVSFSPNKSAAGINLETIGSFAQKLDSDLLESENLISEEAAVLILNQCFKKVKLNYFSQYRTEIPFGTLERIKNVISEYKRHGISPVRLKQEAEELTGAEKLKALDIALVYKKFQSRLKKASQNEIGDIYSNVTNKNSSEFEVIFNNVYPDVNLVIINGFDEFTMPETEIINLTSSINQIQLFVVLDYFKYNPLIFSHLDSCHERFIDLGFKEVKDLSPAPRTKFINSVKEKLSSKTTTGKIQSFKDELVVISARNREEEIELVAKQIKLLLQEGGVEPNKICVVFNLIEKYSPLIRDRFSQFGIPFNLTDRFSLSTSEPVKGILHFLEIAENDFYYKNILRALSNYFVEIEEVDLSNLLKVSVDLKIVSGFSNWINRINEAIKELSVEQEENNNRLLMESYRQAETNIKKINELLQPLNKKLSPQKFSDNLISLVFRLNFPGKLVNASQDLVEKNVKALNTLIESLRELTDILQTDDNSEATYDLKYYLNQLRTLTAFGRYNITEKHGYGVQVTTLNEIRGLKFDYLFICGLNDGDFPTRFSPEVFFSGSFAREELRHQIEQRYLFYQALCVWNKSLYLTFPMFEEKKELVQSNFLQDFLDLFEAKQKNYESYADTIFTRKELLEHYGKLPLDARELLKIKNDLNIDSEIIDRSIEVDDKRQTKPFGKYEYTGFLGEYISEELRNHLNEISKKQFSATQLETYAKCPYKFFLENILKIHTVEEPLEELEAFEFGSLIHSILYEFYTGISKENIILQNCSDDEFRKAEKTLFQIALRKFEEINLNSEIALFEREKLLGIDNNKYNSILYKFIEQERNNDDGYLPSFFELSFGKIKNDTDEFLKTKKEIKAGDVSVRGKIDRIDINDESKTFKVIDYKLSGTAPTSEDIKTGLSVQLPLYMYAAKELISAQFKEQLSPAGAEIFSLKYAEKAFGRKELRIGRKSRNDKMDDRIRAAEEMINICVDTINTYVKQISEGNFNLSTLTNREAKICRYCDFKKICRIQEVSS